MKIIQSPQHLAERQDVFHSRFIHCQVLAGDNLLLQGFQVRLIQLKLQFEGVISQAAPLAQQRDHLIHDRDKIHRVSFRSVVVSGCA
jgi:hypothetical protein